MAFINPILLCCARFWIRAEFHEVGLSLQPGPRSACKASYKVWLGYRPRMIGLRTLGQSNSMTLCGNCCISRGMLQRRALSVWIVYKLICPLVSIWQVSVNHCFPLHSLPQQILRFLYAHSEVLEKAVLPHLLLWMHVLAFLACDGPPSPPLRLLYIATLLVQRQQASRLSVEMHPLCLSQMHKFLLHVRLCPAANGHGALQRSKGGWGEAMQQTDMGRSNSANGHGPEECSQDVPGNTQARLPTLHAEVCWAP